MSLSVIVPNFNDAGRLPRALRALLRQKPQPDEIIIVDDASTDDSIAIIESFQRRYRLIKLIRHPRNRGAPAALNTGLAAATGEFVYFGASDDFVLPGFFDDALTALRAHPQAAYFCARVVLVGVDGSIVDFRPILPPSRTAAFISPAQARRLIRTIDNWAVGQSVVLRRKAISDLGGFDEALGSFCDGIVYRLLAIRDGFYFSDRLATAWEVRRDTLSARSALSPSESPRLIEAAQRRIAELFPPPLNTDYPPLFVRRLAFNVARMALTTPGDDISIIATLPGLDERDRRLVSALGKDTRLSRFTILTWLTLRLRPFGLRALLRAWLERRRTENAHRAFAAERIAEATHLPEDSFTKRLKTAAPRERLSSTEQL
jgi:glycosyltransferase involved in cell wall biosynthesis